MGVFDVTFPQIVVAGTYVGGADDVIEAIENRELPSLLLSGSGRGTGGGEKGEGGGGGEGEGGGLIKCIPWNPSLAEKAGKPDLFTVPHMREGGYPKWPWYVFK